MRLPNLIIAGVPKAGSSSLFYWLEAHPEIYGAPCKETFYFMDLDSPVVKTEANYNLHGLEKYESFFPNCPQDAKFVLDGTPHYVYQETALNFFSKCDPQPHVVVLLRKPSKRIFSSFSFVQKYQGNLDDALTFEEITDILLDKSGKLLQELDYPEDNNIYTWLDAQLPRGCYYNFLKSWAEHFPKEKIHVILFEEMVADPQGTVIKLAEKLNIDADFYREFHFEKRTPTIAIKNRFIHNSLIKIAPLLGTSKIRSLLKSAYYKLNSSSVKPANVDSLARLDEYFVPHNQKLAETFGLNLELWN